ncbi:PEP-CTERM sorting domain-containing protein [Phycisphaera mikurensis]|uniref:Dockerin domain-containing protein n=1 Tax=Phycisphaera mikurensis (strain NBRC 102666 / KCTC 22515 / FYK2301M01) TaxID=1142394 RepID=I0IC34_PHYMF|nr:PEP-CTERM sorting domain-containing protein [Phycisphaera mikurensis]MBB6441955.1 hypothetical protein [Phycisphaera mikurensis]BAM02822.1 hypothetical protein PSMK_06630 [Phycisphaera mikurensis NBRC 102666]
MPKHSRLTRVSSWLAAGFAASALSGTAAAEDLSMYMVGNSLTDQSRIDRVAKIAEGQGHALEFGQHIIWGAGLGYNWQNRWVPSKLTGTYGAAVDALPDHAWDVITLQPYDRPLINPFTGANDEDIAQAMNFIDLAMQNPENVNTRFLIPQFQPQKKITGRNAAGEPQFERPESEPDFDAWWNREYTGFYDQTFFTSSYAGLLRDGIEAEYAARTEDTGPKPGKPIEIVPIGDVFSHLHRLIRADGLELSFSGGDDEPDATPGIDGAWDLYDDGVHPIEVGEYAAGMTFYTVLFGETPIGLPAGEYDVNDEERAAVQAAVRSVVLGSPWEGDANLDGVVDQRDLDAIIDNWGSESVTWQKGDFDASGLIDVADLSNVLDNWGGVGAADLRGLVVPEPSSAAILALLGLAARRRRCR